MKVVTFTKDMAPHKAGESRVVPDDVAQRLVDAGEVEPEPQPFPVLERGATPQPETGRGRRRDYRTKGLI